MADRQKYDLWLCAHRVIDGVAAIEAAQRRFAGTAAITGETAEALGTVAR